MTAGITKVIPASWKWMDIKSQFLRKNDGRGTGGNSGWEETSGNSAWGLGQRQHGSQTPLLHTSSSVSLTIRYHQILFRSIFHEANRLLQHVRASLHHALHLLDSFGFIWIIERLLSTHLLVCRRRTREGCTQHKSHRTSLWNCLEPVSRISFFQNTQFVSCCISP